MKLDYTLAVEGHWDSKAQSEWDDIRQAILSDPCLVRFNWKKRTYLLTDFCAKGFIGNVTQIGKG